MHRWFHFLITLSGAPTNPFVVQPTVTEFNAAVAVYVKLPFLNTNTSKSGSHLMLAYTISNVLRGWDSGASNVFLSAV